MGRKRKFVADPLPGMSASSERMPKKRRGASDGGLRTASIRLLSQFDAHGAGECFLSDGDGGR